MASCFFSTSAKARTSIDFLLSPPRVSLGKPKYTVEISYSSMSAFSDSNVLSLFKIKGLYSS